MSQDVAAPSLETLFEERQLLGRNPLTWGVVPAALLMWAAAISQLGLGIPFGAKPAPGWLLLVLLGVAGVVLPGVLLLSSLHVRVTPRAVHLRFTPFARRSIPTAAVRRVQLRDSDALSEYQGWGVRRGPGGRSFTVWGSSGVQLELQDGERIFVGSRRAEELAQAIQVTAGRGGHG